MTTYDAKVCIKYNGHKRPAPMYFAAHNDNPPPTVTIKTDEYTAIYRYCNYCISGKYREMVYELETVIVED